MIFKDMDFTRIEVAHKITACLVGSFGQIKP